MINLTLPEPDTTAAARSAGVSELIVEAIRQQQGAIGFDHFMELALYAPELGYYDTAAPKIGAAGDFVTAPVISALFSCCLAEQCMQVIKAVPDAAILELGAGTGVMARDILLALERQQQLPERYFILEVSAGLKRHQQQLLQQSIPQLMSRVHWLEQLPEQGFNGIVLGNEVLDAMPVKRISFGSETIRECCVAHQQDSFCWVERAAPEELQQQADNIIRGLDEKLPAGYTSEINLRHRPWINSLARCLNQGIILFSDYGYGRSEYYHPQRSDGTLLCHYQHRAHADPFYYPGLQDITAAVDFTAVADYAVQAGLTVAGYTTQAGFLLACEPDRQINELAAHGQGTALQLAAQAKLLLLPGEMGEKFKVIGLGKNFDEALTGFAFNSQLQHL